MCHVCKDAAQKYPILRKGKLGKDIAVQKFLYSIALNSLNMDSSSSNNNNLHIDVITNNTMVYKHVCAQEIVYAY